MTIVWLIRWVAYMTIAAFAFRAAWKFYEYRDRVAAAIAGAVAIGFTYLAWSGIGGD